MRGQQPLTQEALAAQIEKALEIADGRIVTALPWDNTPPPAPGTLRNMWSRCMVVRSVGVRALDIPT